MPLHDIYFFYKNQILENDKTLSDYEVVNAATIRMKMKINVKVDARRLTLIVNPSDKIELIADQIASGNHMDQDLWSLEYSDEPLDFNRTFADGGIKSDYTLIAKRLIKLSLMDLFKCEKTMIVSPSLKIEELRKIIRHLMKIPEDSNVLLFNKQRLLEDGHSLNDYDITEHNCDVTCGLNLNDLNPNSAYGHILNLNVCYKKDTENKIMSFNVLCSIRIKEIKQEISDEIGIPPSMQRLFFKKRELGNNLPLNKCNVDQNDMLLDLEKAMNIVIENLVGGKSFPLDVFPSETVTDLSVKIFEEVGIEPDHQRLVFHSRSLQPEKKLNYYNIKHWDTIYWVRRYYIG
eukprot:GHVL01028655.1.p1 GENE.GHVL01028655.1~~GHVL01028655.1.p1  ORF type:complete len:347 (-),score=18.48 GHVL01028655.1:87-1127(-)